MKKPGFVMAVLVISAAALGVLAAEPQEAPEPVLDRLAEVIPEARPDRIRPAAVPGFYEVSYDAEIFYVSDDGRFMLRGDLLDLASQVNLTEVTRSEFRSGLLKSLDSDETIDFAPPGAARHVVYIFTDTDCNFCRRMHHEMEQYNKAGIAIRYLAYPRSGPGTPSFDTMVSVWCAEDRKAAMDQAKAGKSVRVATCENPVIEHLKLGDRVGVTGTPTMVLADGSTLPGYIPPDRLAGYLDMYFAER